MMSSVDDLTPIAGELQQEFTVRNAARDAAISISRELIRHCAECIRAIHRREWQQTETKFKAIKAASSQLRSSVVDFPELYYAGYTQDALKEVVEAYVTHAIIRQLPLPTPDSLQVEPATFLKGLGEAATELRRFILDIMRRSDRHSDEAERLLDWMDSIYDHLITFDFPDALTYGLRRQTDVVRGVLERTRGDMTSSLREQRLQDALKRFEQRVIDEES